MDRTAEIERSIITTYRKRIWGRFVRGVKEFSMACAGDKIAVCISGGKDSMLLAKCMQELKRHSPVKFDLEFICKKRRQEDTFTLYTKMLATIHLPFVVFMLMLMILMQLLTITKQVLRKAVFLHTRLVRLLKPKK